MQAKIDAEKLAALNALADDPGLGERIAVVHVGDSRAYLLKSDARAHFRSG